MEERIIRCPVCDTGSVKVLYTPPLKQQRKQYYGAGHKGTVTIFTDEKYEALEDCQKCGAKKGEIGKKLIGHNRKPMTRQEMLKRLKDAGLPTKL